MYLFVGAVYFKTESCLVVAQETKVKKQFQNVYTLRPTSNRSLAIGSDSVVWQSEMDAFFKKRKKQFKLI